MKKHFQPPTNINRVSEMDFRYTSNHSSPFYIGHIRFESLNSTENSERARGELSVRTGSTLNDWAGIAIGHNDSSYTAGFGSIAISTAPLGNDVDLLLTGQSANFGVAVRPAMLTNDPGSNTPTDYSTGVHGSPLEGQIYYNTTSNTLKFHNGTTWAEIGTGSGGGGSSTFLGLSDTPASFTASRFVKVNSAGNAIEFATAGLSASDIPDLDTAKITSGVFSPARLASGGSTGQYLERTASGTRWSTVSGGGTGQFTAATNGIYYNSGNVAIGRNAIEAGDNKLQVMGSIKASGDIDAYQTFTSSDIRLKENIENIENPLSKILSMRGVFYNRKGEKNQQVGLIAQEVKDIVPQVVKDPQDDYMSISYGNLVGLLVEAIKEQTQKINILEEKISNLSS